MLKDLLFFLKIGAVSFGKMRAENYMLDEFTNKKKSLTVKEFFTINGMCRLLPGATLVQMCVVLGDSEKGRLFGVLSGIAYTLPSFLMVTFAAYLYFEHGFDLHKLNYGMVPFSVALMFSSTVDIGDRHITSPFTMFILIYSIILAYFGMPVMWNLLICGLMGYISRCNIDEVWKKIKSWFSSNKLNAAPIVIADMSIFSLFVFFMKVGLLSYGGSMVMIPMIQNEMVFDKQWLTQEEFLFGFVAASVAPGPVLLTVAFIAYKAAMVMGYAGIAGSFTATTAVMLPSFVLSVFLSKYIVKERDIKWLTGITSGVMPASLGSMVVMGLSPIIHSLGGAPPVLIAALFFTAHHFFRINSLILLVIAMGMGFIFS